MHSCPACDQACYCNGDIDDIMFGEPYWCVHDCEEVDGWFDDEEVRVVVEVGG